MKVLNTNQFINERLKVKPVTNAELDVAQKKYEKYKYYKYFPKTSKQLQKLIQKRIEKEGPYCDLNDICTEKITDMSYLFAFLKARRSMETYPVGMCQM